MLKTDRFVLLTLLVIGIVSVLGQAPTLSALSHFGIIPGDPSLSEAEVMRWFDSSLTRGDGQKCEVRPGNEVVELIDGAETFAKMAEAIKTASKLGEAINTAQMVPVLYYFRNQPDPNLPKEIGAVAEGLDGNLYSTSPSGGKYNLGTVFKITPDCKTLTVLWEFDGITGRHPQGGLTRGKDGNFYGTTYAGGKYGVGTVFRITPKGGKPTTIWDFRNGKLDPPPPPPPSEQDILNAAGGYPVSAPVLGSDGNLYGVTTYAKNEQAGVLYTISGAYRAMCLFKDKERKTFPNGKLPQSLIAASDGNLYGTTLKGDASCPYGTVFKATRAGGISTIFKFDATHGTEHYSLTQGSDGNLYGTTHIVGQGPHTGLVYKLPITGGAPTILHTFSVADGANPVAGVVQARDGYLYGAAKDINGGRGGIYRVRPDGTDFALLYKFPLDMGNGRYPVTTPMQHTNGRIYGTAKEGGKYNGVFYNRGVFYSLDANPFVYLLGWWLTDSFPLIPGDSKSTIQDLFKDASDKGVPVRAMLSNHLAPHPTEPIAHINNLSNGAAIHDNRFLNFGSHHQKILIVNGSEGLIAFCGGIDINPDRFAVHDVHCRIKGPAAGDLLNIFGERWNDHPDHGNLDKNKGALRGAPAYIPSPIEGATHWVQVGRTYGNGTKYDQLGSGGPYSFAPNGEQTAGRMIIKGIQQAEKFIYVEDQYFVETAPNEKLGLDIRAALIATLKKPSFQHLTVLIPHPSIATLPEGNLHRREFINALRAAGGNKVRVFNMVGTLHTYVHSKTWIFDDQFAIIGSANCCRRSFTHDSEVVAGICDQGNGASLWFPHRLRMRLWAEHLNVGMDSVRDPIASADMWNQRSARIAPYDVNLNVEESILSWDSEIDPDGS
jgi:uncharacterized repeat protein (TIGR03803 family)